MAFDATEEDPPPTRLDTADAATVARPEQRAKRGQGPPEYRPYGAGMAELDANQRKHMKDSDFAEPEQRKYPMEDETHARNALSRVAQHGSQEEQEEVRKRVEKKYPSLKKD